MQDQTAIDPHSGAASAQQCWLPMPQRTSSHHTLIQQPTTSVSLELPGRHTVAAPRVLGVALESSLKITPLKDGLKARDGVFKKQERTRWELVFQREVKVNLITGLPVQKTQFQMAQKLPAASSSFILSKCCCLQLNSQGKHLHWCGTMKMTKLNYKTRFFFSPPVQTLASISHKKCSCCCIGWYI